MPEPLENTLEIAFIVGVTSAGGAVVYLDPRTEVTTSRDATMRDVQRICTEVVDDLHAQSAAQYVMLALKAVAEEKSKNETPSAKVGEALQKRRRR